MSDGFRIRRILIEGFKGFTTKQEVDLRNRHVFLLGSNGNGKSSVIEAIRWGLFGSTNRPGDIVANSEYGKRCRVEIGLLRDGNEWTLRRTLIRGASGGSDARLMDDAGNERHISDVMPQLDSLDAGEGTHIIFAPQSTPLKRQPEDLKPFERTVYDHLGLTSAKALAGHVKTFLADLRDEEEVLEERVSTLRKRVEGSIELHESKRSGILRSPPWGEGNAPTLTESEDKARRLIERVALADDEPPPKGTSLGALIQEAESALENRSAQPEAALQEKLEMARTRLRQLERLREMLDELNAKKAELANVRSRQAEVMGSKSLEGLRREAEARRGRAQTLDLRRELAAREIEVMRQEEDSTSASCPICRQSIDRERLQSALEAHGREPRDEEMADLREAERVLGEAETLTSDVGDKARKEDELKRELTSSIQGIEGMSDRSIEELEGGYLEGEITTASERITSREAQVRNHQAWFDGVRREIETLREEEKYHDVRRKLTSLRSIEVDFGRAKRVYDSLVRFGQSVKEIGDAVEATLTDELRGKTPAVATEFSRAFAALTRHPHFDKVTFDEAKLPQLEMRVSSSRSPESTYPTGVLNGQAQSALDLVPYFAFGGAKEAPTEVYLVLLDDPTRAFDREHIAILIDRLADLGRRVQVVVASQETEVFRELIPHKFDRADYVVIEPRNWSFEDGPFLKVEYE